MTLASDIIQQAYREGNIIPVGGKPTQEEQDEALGRLNSLISGFYGTGMGELLKDWLAPQPQRTASVAANYPQDPLPRDASSAVTPYPPKNRRIVWGGVATTIWFPEAPDDGTRMALVQGSGAGLGGVSGAVLTIDGNGRHIEGADTVSYTNPVVPRQWLYRADLGDWKAVTALASTDDMVFSPDLDDLWIGLLAMRLAGRYNKQLGAETVSMIKRTQKEARARFHQTQDVVLNSVGAAHHSVPYSPELYT